MRILTEAEIQQFVGANPDWYAEGGTLVASFQLPTFREAAALVQLIFLQAEQQNHHPELHNVFSKVTVRLTTHDAGNQISDRDTEMAAYISNQAAKLR